jgi:hypothetical protein
MLHRLLAVLIFAALGTPLLPAAADPPQNFTGSYELAGHRTDRSFTLQVSQDGKRAKVSFSAAMADGSGAAPDADGTGKIEHGVLAFKFKDSFDNEGTCKLQLQPSTEVYQLDMVITKVVESSPLHFYGTLQLKKVSSQPISP